MKKFLLLLCSSFTAPIITSAQTALDLAGAGNRCETAYNLNVSGGWTIEYNMYIHNMVGLHAGVTQGCANVANPIDFYINGVGTTTQFWGTCSATGGNTAAGITAGNWRHYAYSYDPGLAQGRFYIDGVLMGTYAVPALGAPSVPLTIGDRADGVTNANAKFDNVRVWDIVRSDADILANYNGCIDPTTAGLDILYTMEENSGTTVYDMALTDGAQNGTIIGGATWTSGFYCPVCPVVDVAVNTNDYATVCQTDTTIEIAGSTPGIYYFLRDDADNSVIDGPFEGTGSPLTFSTGTLYSTTTMNVLGTPYGGAIDTDGVNEYINIGTDASLDITGDITLETWIYMDALQPDWVRLIGKGDAGGNRTYGLWVSATGNVLFQMYGSTIMNLTSPSTLSVGQWYHLAAVRSGSDCRLYINGALVNATIYADVPFLTVQAATLVGNPVIHDYLDGRMDDARIWNIGKTQDEVNAGMYACVAGTEPGLVASFSMEDGTGSPTASDATGTNNGTLTNMEPTTDWTFGMPTCADCNTQMTETVTITVDPLMDQTVTTSDYSTVCQTDTTIELAGSQSGMWYGLQDASDGSWISAGPVIGTGGTISLPTGPITTTTTIDVATVTPEANSYALDFDGVNDYINLPLMNLSIFSEMTIEAWIRPNDITANPNYEITRQGFGGPQGWLFAFQANGTILSFGLQTTSGYDELDAAVAAADFTDGDWHHVAAVYDGANRYIYVDGVEIGSDVKTGTISFPGGANFIGASPTIGEYFNGSIDRVRFWTVAKSATEIEADMDNCLTGNEAGLFALYNCIDGTGSVILTDETTFGNNGTLTNMDPSTDWVGADMCFECYLLMSDNITITVDPISDLVVTVDNDTLCPPDGTPVVTVESTQNGVTYYLRDDSDDSVIDGPVSGTGGDITLDPGTVLSDMTYNVYAEVGTSDPTQSVLEMDGVNEYVITPNVNMSSIFTYETWVKANDPSPDWSGIISSNSGVGSGMIFQFCLSGSGQLRWETFGPFSFFDNMGPVINDNTWHHVAVTSDGTNLRFYTDGVLVSTNAFAASPMDRPLHIMAERVPTQWIPGQVDRTMVWQYARSGSEILSDMSSCPPEDESGLMIYYEYEDGTGSTVTDLTWGDYNGTMLNMEVSDWISGAGPVSGCIACSIEMTDIIDVVVEGPTITVDASTDANCFGAADGTADVSVTDGSMPYVYDWEDDGTGDYDDVEDHTSLIAGTWTVAVMDNNGCIDSTEVTIGEPAEITGSMSTNICDGDSILIGSTYQFTAGTYMDTLTSVATGCDSVLTVTLGVDPSYETTLAVVEICDGDSALVFGTYVSTSGFYYDSLTTVGPGCDSIYIQEVIVNSVDVSVSYTAGDLVAGASGAGITYQWIDCSTGTPIVGETGQAFTPTQNGDYAVIVTDGTTGCVDTSACTSITDVGFNDLTGVSLSIFPNPTNGQFNIALTGTEIQQVIIHNALGQIVWSQLWSASTLTVDLSSTESGAYLVSVVTAKGVIRKTVVIQ